MALPMNSTPTYNLVIPSTKKTVKYRPFLVKEEKSILIAQQSEDIVVMVDTLKDVIRSCILDKIDPDSLSTFDLEYIFTQIRGKSVGEIIELFFPCDVDHGEQNDKAKVKISIDLTKIEVEFPEDHTNKIELFGEVGMIMKYPTIEIMTKLEKTDSDDLDNIFEIVADCIDLIYEGDKIHYAKETKKEELLEFLYNLNSEQFIKVQNFFATLPRIKKEVEYNCPICGLHHKKVLEGMQSFF
jgi:rubrerythrin